MCTDRMTDDYPRLMEAIESARYAHSDGMGAYMCFMAVRLLEMHRIPKPAGSIHLHCGPTAPHSLKAVWMRSLDGSSFGMKLCGVTLIQRGAEILITASGLMI